VRGKIISFTPLLIISDHLVADLNNPRSRFFDYLLASNQPLMDGFDHWLFQAGMLFGSWEKWWGDGKKRATAHEGLDLCGFQDSLGAAKMVDLSLKIPAAFAGKIVKIAGDFLGKSIYLSHEIFSEDGFQLYTVYGHTEPLASMAPSQEVAEGQIVATLSRSFGKNPTIPPHLHVTFAWLPAPLPPARLTWQNLSHDPAIRFIDPLTVLAPPI